MRDEKKGGRKRKEKDLLMFYFGFFDQDGWRGHGSAFLANDKNVKKFEQ